MWLSFHPKSFLSSAELTAPSELLECIQKYTCMKTMPYPKSGGPTHSNHVEHHLADFQISYDCNSEHWKIVTLEAAESNESSIFSNALVAQYCCPQDSDD